MKKNSKENKTGKGLEPHEPMPEIKRIKIEELIFDDRNANMGTELGKEIIQTSISNFGIGRGILVDKDMKIIAGNHAAREIAAQGYKDVIVVPTNGKTLVLTQRLDIDKDSKAGHGLAIADNRTTQANLSFDFDLIKDLDTEFDLELADLAINMDDIGEFSQDNESENLGNAGGSGEKESDSITQNLFPVTAALSKEERARFDAYKKANGLSTDTETIIKMLNILHK